MYFLIAIIACAVLSAFASRKVSSAFKKYDRVRCISGYTGEQAARSLLHYGGVTDVSVGRVSGTLSDHYHPTKKVVNLSASTYDSSSVAAVAVAAHEIGHVMQKTEGYLPYRIRTALVPVVNFGSRLSMPLVFLGIIIDALTLSTNPELGFYIAMLGVILYAGSFVFALVTLPVELNASRRAHKMLLSRGILYESETEGVKKVLFAAALTYLASLLTSLVYFLRFLFYVLSIFGRRNRR